MCGDGGRGGGRGARDGHGIAGARGEGGGGGWWEGGWVGGWVNGRGRGHTDTATVGTVLFCDVRKFSRATSAMMMDVLIDEQELPEPVRLRAICVVPGEWEKLGRIRHERTTT